MKNFMCTLLVNASHFSKINYKTFILINMCWKFFENICVAWEHLENWRDGQKQDVNLNLRLI
jgi:hypothetical protein